MKLLKVNKEVRLNYHHVIVWLFVLCSYVYVALEIHKRSFVLVAKRKRSFTSLTGLYIKKQQCQTKIHLNNPNQGTKFFAFVTSYDRFQVPD